MVKRLLCFAIVAWAVVAMAAQSYLPHRRAAFRTGTAAAPGCTVSTNALGITLLTSYGDTSNATSHATASVSPAADSTLILFAAYSPTGTETVTNTGTLQLSWLPLTNVSFNTIASPAHELVAYVSQMPPGVSSFAMRVVLTGISYTGANMHLLEITGADTNLLWGQNASVQVRSAVSNAVANPQITISAPNASGSNAVLIAVADDINSNADNAAGTGQTELGETAYNTPAAGLASYYLTNAQPSQTLYTHTATARDLAMIAIEIRAGTNACGSGEEFPAYGITRYVHTGVVGGTRNTPGGDGTTTNLTGATRAYASIQDAILQSFASEPTVLAVPWKFVLMGNWADTGAVTQTTWNRVGTSYTNYLWLEVHSDWRHDGKWNTNKFWMSVTNDSLFYMNGPGAITASHVRFGWIQGQVTSTDGADYNVFRFSTLNVTNAGGLNAADLRGYNLIARGTNTAGANNISGFRNSPYNGDANGGGKTRLWNCIAFGCESGFVQDKTDVWVVNCLAHGNQNNFVDPQITINCISAAHTSISGFLGVGTGGGFSRNNSTDDTSAEGHHCRQSQTFTFVNAGTYDFHLQSGDGGAKNFGFNFPFNVLFSDDIDGQTRPNVVNWDIGPDEQQ
jgi:hypothetical protein